MKMLQLTMVLTMMLLVSCNKNNVYSEFNRDFEENQWQRADVKTFHFEITDATKSYDLLLDFSHVAGFQFDKLPLKIEITNPDHTKTIQNLWLTVTDSQGQDLGDCDGDYCDLSQPVFQKKKLAAGQYIVTIANEFNHEYVPNVLGFGIKVNRSENQ